MIVREGHILLIVTKNWICLDPVIFDLHPCFIISGIVLNPHEIAPLQGSNCFFLLHNVYIFIHERHKLGSTITNCMVSEVLPRKTGIKHIYEEHGLKIWFWPSYMT